MVSYFQWLKADYGFDESKVKPYTFNAQPFLADKNSAKQGYLRPSPTRSRPKATSTRKCSSSPTRASMPIRR